MDTRSSAWMTIGGALVSIASYLISADHRTTAAWLFVIGTAAFIIGLGFLIYSLASQSHLQDASLVGLNLTSLPPGQNSEARAQNILPGQSSVPQQSIQPLKPPYYPPQRKLAPHEGMGGIPFPNLVNPPWSDYTKDMFYDVIWRWHYKLEFDSTPRDLIPFCPECDRPLIVWEQSNGIPIPGSKKLRWFALCRCEFHPREYQIPVDARCDFTPIKDLIQQKIQDGSYDDVVTRQRMHRGW